MNIQQAEEYLKRGLMQDQGLSEQEASFIAKGSIKSTLRQATVARAEAESKAQLEEEKRRREEQLRKDAERGKEKLKKEKAKRDLHDERN